MSQEKIADIDKLRDKIREDFQKIGIENINDDQIDQIIAWAAFDLGSSFKTRTLTAASIMGLLK